MGEGAAETQTHSERGKETYRVKERVKETDTKIENRERKRKTKKHRVPENSMHLEEEATETERQRA